MHLAKRSASFPARSAWRLTLGRLRSHCSGWYSARNPSTHRRRDLQAFSIKREKQSNKSLVRMLFGMPPLPPPPPPPPCHGRFLLSFVCLCSVPALFTPFFLTAGRYRGRYPGISSQDLRSTSGVACWSHIIASDWALNMADCVPTHVLPCPRTWKYLCFSLCDTVCTTLP